MPRSRSFDSMLSKRFIPYVTEDKLGGCMQVQRRVHQQSCICLIGLESGRSGQFRPFRRSGGWTEFSRFLPEFGQTHLGPALSDVEISDQTGHPQYVVQALFRPYIGYIQVVFSIVFRIHGFLGLRQSDRRCIKQRVYCKLSTYKGEYDRKRNQALLKPT